ncbi:MAG: methionine--tRNA ligase [Dehalococcoidia bacterium]
MPENILIGVAWPYANGSLHLGQIAGAYLPADIFARYQRAAGNRVLMVGGSDQHGTPIMVRAEQEGTTPQAIVDRYHPEFLKSWGDLGITYDLFTTTGTKNHEATVHEFFLRLLEKGYIYKNTVMQFYDSQAKRFLPDRYVEGTCPRCGYERARGDQCDNCGSTLDATDLINPKSRFTGTTPEQRETEHFFFKFSDFNEPLLEWLSKDKEHWRTHVLNFSIGLLKEGMPDRAITRDLEWGVTVPIDELGEGKRIYVWYEALLGYLSAAKEWSQLQGTPEAWRDFWENPDAKTYYFIGKDNIVFHTLLFPAWLQAYEGLNLPYDVPANQYVNFHGSKASTSLGTAPFLPLYLERYDPDTIRYYLAAIMPETSDSEFSDEELVRRNNEELVSTWGNLVNRVLTITYRTFEGRVPEPGTLRAQDEELLAQGAEALASVGASINACKFREGLRTALGFAQETNRYLNAEEPWNTRKTDPAAAARSLYTALAAIEILKVAFNPYLPFTSEKLNEMLGHTTRLDAGSWAAVRPEPGTALQEPVALFKKLDALEPSA